MSRLSEACSRPFSNGTEGEAWMSRWCSFCVHDHGAHDETYESCCSIIGASMTGEVWPEAWLPEPDDGSFSLPSRMICGQFMPCSLGDCCGDPSPVGRAEQVAEVTAYWKEVGFE